MTAPLPFDSSPEAWSNRLAGLVWCTGVADQLPEIAAWLGLPSGSLPPEKAVNFASYEVPEKGLILRLHYAFPERVVTVDPNQWMIADVTFDPSHAPLPFGLDARTETPDSASRTLGRDRTDFPATHTTTFYLEDLRAVSIWFHPSGVGIRSVRVTRLYGAIPFQQT